MITFFSRILKSYRAFRKPATIVFAIMMVTQIISMARPWLYGMASDTLIHAQQRQLSLRNTMSEVLVIAGFIWLSSLISNGLWAFRQSIEVVQLDHEMDRHIQHKTLKRLLEYSPGQHLAENSGLKQSVVNKGQHALNTLAYTTVYELAPVLLECSILVIGLMWLNWRIGLVVLGGIAAYVSATIMINKPFVPKLKKYEKLWHANSRLHHEVIRNLPLVQFNAQEERILDECDASVSKVGTYAKGIWLAYQLQTALKNGVIIGGITAAVVVTAAYAVATHACSLGQFMTLIWWSLSPIGRIESLTAIQRRVLTMRTSIEKYWDMLAIEPDVKEADKPVHPATIRGKIQFQDVSFTYPDRKSGIESDEDDDDLPPSCKDAHESVGGVSFIVNPGERVAIVGRSGAGKSTLIKLILRASDVTSGRIRVDGYDVRQLSVEHLRGAIGMVEQDVTLFDNTLRYNITFGLDRHSREQITDAELDRICRLCRIDQFMHRMEHGYDTVIGERGIQLSGGQRQRVGIARAIIKNPAILILDEATNNLDSESEQLISKALEEVSRNRTTIIIAHRFSTIRGADRILVMDEGCLIDTGTHEELAQRCAIYQRLLENQLSAS